MNKSLKLFLSLCSVLLLGSVAGSAATYYVSPTGDDTAPGSSAQPWQTIQKAASALGAGDKAVVRAGVYGERVLSTRSGTEGSGRIIFQAEGQVVMKGWVINHSYITVQGFDITGHSASSITDAHVRVNKDGHFFELTGCTVRDGVQIVNPDLIFNAVDNTITSATGGFVADGFVAGQTLYVGRTPTDRTVLNLGTHTITAVTDNSLTVSSAIVDDGPLSSYLSASYEFGLYLDSRTQHALIRNCRFRNLGYDAWLITGSGHTFEGNIIEQANGWDAMHFGGTDHLFRSNTIRNSSIIVYQPSGDAMENWSPTPYARVTFTNNFIYNFEGVLAAQKGSGDSTGLRLVRNVFVDVGRMILTHPNTVIDQNTFLRVSWQNHPGVSVAKHPIYVDTEVGATNIVIRNNVFVDCGQPTGSVTHDVVGWYEIDGPSDSVTAEGNFVAGGSPNFAAKTGWPESNSSLNGGDPLFFNVDDPLGPDGLAFTDDDGLRLLPSSKLVSAGVGGFSVGAYQFASLPSALTIDYSFGGQVRVRWPESSESWSLEGAPAVTGVWTNVQGLLPQSGGWFEYSFQPSEAGAFFRLRQ